MSTATARREARDETIREYHTRKGPALCCPTCRAWNPLRFDSPQGVTMTCGVCGTLTIMPRVQLARAIERGVKVPGR